MQKMIKVWAGDNIVLFNYITTRLSEENIDFVANNEAFHFVFPSFPFEIRVTKDNEQRAKNIVNEVLSDADKKDNDKD